MASIPFLAGLLTAQPQPPTPSYKAAAQEVLLDVIVRDNKGRVVRDLKPEEFEVFDAGKRVEIKSFHFVEGGEARAPEPSPATPRPAAEAPALDPHRQIRLVSIVFERLSPNGRQLFKQAAFDLINSPADPNLYFSVFYIDQRLHLLQQFTNDRALLRKGVERAIGGSYSQYAAQSQEVEKSLQETTQLENAAADLAAAPQSNAQAIGPAAAAAALARMQLNMLQFSSSNTALQQSRGSLFALLALVKEQTRLPGRKMVLYFSEDFKVPGDAQEHFRTVVSTANRANVSIYTVDARGLVTASQNDEGRSLLNSAAASSRSSLARYRGHQTSPVTPDQVRMFDTTLDALRANIQASLEELATSTGGFLIADSNDLRTPLRRALEEVRSYYAIAYLPEIVNYDGRFHPILVKLSRPDTTVQTRSGYYALPPLSDAPLFPFEMPLLNALTRSPLPQAFPYHAAAQRFDPRGSEIEYGVAVEVPVKDLTFAVDQDKKVAQLRPSVLILFKNQQGAVVAKMSRDLPREVPLERMDAFRNGHLVLTYKALLAPGQYTLETAVGDRNAEAVSARRSALAVPAPLEKLSVSEPVLVRSLEGQPEEADGIDPYHFAGGKAVPTFDGSLARGGEATLYFVVYPERGNSARPELTLAVIQGRKLFLRSSPALPQPDSAGRIPYLAALPLRDLPAGEYELRVIVKQGASAAAEHLYVTVN